MIGFSVGKWIPSYVSLEDMKQAATRGEIVMTPGVLIADVRADGTAQKAGVPAKSMLLAVDGSAVYVPQDIVDAQTGKAVVTYHLRTPAGVESDVSVPVEDGKTGVELQFSPGVSAPNRSLLMGLGLALREVKVTTVQTIIGMGELFKSLFLSARIPEGITGIVGIAVLTHNTIQEGFMPYLRLVANLSLSLAIFNALPFPALDGGRLMFVLYEGIRRRPAPRKLELTTNAIGFIFLLTLIVLITTNDIFRLF